MAIKRVVDFDSILDKCINQGSMDYGFLPFRKLMREPVLEIEYPVRTWINIKTEMPEDMFPGLYRENQVPCVLVTDGNWMAMAYHHENKWIFAEATNANIEIDWTTICYWMPLPELPKEVPHE